MAAAGCLLCLLSALLASSVVTGGRVVRIPYYFLAYQLKLRCDLLQPPVPAIFAEMLPSGDGRDAGAAAGPCSDALQQIHDIHRNDCPQVFRFIADLLSSCPTERLHGTEWNSTTADTSDWSHHSLPQLLHAFHHVMKVTVKFKDCSQFNVPEVKGTTFYGARDSVAKFPAVLQLYREYWRHAAQLISVAVPLLSEMFVPFAVRHVGNHINDQQLHGWTEKVEHLRDMVNTRLLGLLHDAQFLQEQILNYTIEDASNWLGVYLVRYKTVRPLTYDEWLYRSVYPSFWDDFGAVCEDQLQNASLVFRLADAFIFFYAQYWAPMSLGSFSIGLGPILGDNWQLEDQSDVTLSVDTECLQLLVDGLDHPRCPLEELPPETSTRQTECRRQLLQDVLHRAAHVPVTSYLAYTQRAHVSLCLLAWMVTNSNGICHHVPFTISHSVYEADCYIRTPNDKSCPKSKDADAICYVSRAIMLMKCQDFYTIMPKNSCDVYFYGDGSYLGPLNLSEMQDFSKTVDTRRTIAYKHSATLKYRDFKIVSLRSLEISFVTLNILFRALTAGVYLYLPRLRNLPGKLLLCFQVTGLAQILCSEVVHRMAGVLPLSAAVLVDSGLTLLSCLWLNTFCYQMYACVRHLRLPDDLEPPEASKIFRLQVVYALIPCAIVSAASSALEITSKYYVLYSRIIFVTGISLSIAFNLVCLGLVAYMYKDTRKSMQQLRIHCNNKSASKKYVIFMSVKTVILSGIGIIVRIGFHQAQDIPQFVYYVHIATMLQGPALFVLFVCNGRTLPVLRNRVLGWLNSDTVSPDLELCSAAERNLERRANKRRLVAESTF